MATAGQTEEALAAADKMADASRKVAVLHDVAQVLVKAGQTQGALAAADKIADAGIKAETLKEIATVLADKVMMEQANLVLDKAVRITENISDEKVKSNTNGEIAAIYARLTQYRPARLAAEKSKMAGDTLNGYMMILKYYAIEEHPELAEKLAKLEMEDKR